MANKPGISWGPSCPFNAMRTSRGWVFVDFSGKPRIVACLLKWRGMLLPYDVSAVGAILNYGTTALARGMAAELDAVA